MSEYSAFMGETDATIVFDLLMGKQKMFFFVGRRPASAADINAIN
jgi:hypothetical protein